MKKVLSLILVLCMVLCVLVSCGNKDGSDTPSGSDTAGDKYTWPSNLDYSGYDGYDFRILEWGGTGGEHWSAFEFYYNEGLEGDVVNDAVKTRDSKLEEKLNINIEYVEKGVGEILEFARQSIDAGADDFDLISAKISDAASLAQDNKLYNLYDYSNILNLNEKWWNQSANEQLSIDNRLYFTINNLTLVDKNSTWVVFFTKSMLDAYPGLTEGYENGLYDMVKQGDWTIEKMDEMVKTVSGDVNGDGEYTEVDRYGHVGEQFNLGALMIGCGSRVSKKDADDIPQYVWLDSVDSLVDSYSYVNEIVMDTNYSMLSGRLTGLIDGDVWVDGFGSMMNDDRVLFNVTGMNRCRLYRGLECSFGIVPVPKANKSQTEYYSPMSMGFANTVAIPVSVTDPERSATVLEAMTCLADQTTYTAYLDKAVAYKYLQADKDSLEMLDIIFANRIFDSVDVYGMGDGTYAMFGKNPQPSKVASNIKALQKYTQNKMKNVIEKFREFDDLNAGK